MFTPVYSCLTMFTTVCKCLPMFATVYSCMFTHVYSCLPMLYLFTYDYCCLIVLIYVYSCLPMFKLLYLCLPLFTRVYLCLPLFTPAFLCLPMFTFVYYGGPMSHPLRYLLCSSPIGRRPFTDRSPPFTDRSPTLCRSPTCAYLASWHVCGSVGVTVVSCLHLAGHQDQDLDFVVADYNLNIIIYCDTFLVQEFYSWKSYWVILLKMNAKFGIIRRSVLQLI